MNTQRTIGEIVAENFRTAAVFQEYEIDFCCRGGRTIEEACTDKSIDADAVLERIASVLASGPDPSMKFDEWDLAFLASFIEKNHHGYVRRMIPVLRMHTQKIASVHGGRHPELVEVARHFEAVATELEAHMLREEQMLFPFIAALEHASLTGGEPPRSPFGSVSNPIARMKIEHEHAGDEMATIRSLTSGYTPPEDGCTTYRVAFQELAEFEADLHQHVHLENNILFPKAIAIEKRFNAPRPVAA